MDLELGLAIPQIRARLYPSQRCYKSRCGIRIWFPRLPLSLILHSTVDTLVFRFGIRLSLSTHIHTHHAFLHPRSRCRLRRRLRTVSGRHSPMRSCVLRRCGPSFRLLSHRSEVPVHHWQVEDRGFHHTVCAWKVLG